VDSLGTSRGDISNTPTLISNIYNFSFLGTTAPSGPGPPRCWGFTITLIDTPQSVELLWTRVSAKRRDLYLTTQNTYKRQTFMLQSGFKPWTPAS